jgi:hypothetical protein
MPKKVQYNNSFGLDLTQVVGWKRIITHQNNPMFQSDDWGLELYTSGNTIIVEKSTLSEEDLNNLLKHLIEEFSRDDIRPMVDERTTTIMPS